MSPPDIARATGHSLEAVDNYLGTYGRIKVLLRKGFDVATICQVTGKAPRTIAQYLVIIENYHQELLNKENQKWLVTRRKKVQAARPLPKESMTPIVTALIKSQSSSKSSRKRGPKK